MITKPANISLRHGGREQVLREAADPAREVSRLLRIYQYVADYAGEGNREFIIGRGSSPAGQHTCRGVGDHRRLDVSGAEPGVWYAKQPSTMAPAPLRNRA